MSIEITEELIALVEEHRHYRTEATARHLAAYICEEMEQVQEELGINHGNINSCVNKHRKTAGGYRWEAICV